MSFKLFTLIDIYLVSFNILKADKYYTQYSNQYPSKIFESTDNWLSYYSNDCKHIKSIYTSNELDLSTIQCIEYVTPLSFNVYYDNIEYESYLMELYNNSLYSVILLDDHLFDFKSNINPNKKVIYGINLNGSLAPVSYFQYNEQSVGYVSINTGSPISGPNKQTVNDYLNTFDRTNCDIINIVIQQNTIDMIYNEINDELIQYEITKNMAESVHESYIFGWLSNDDNNDRTEILTCLEKGNYIISIFSIGWIEYDILFTFKYGYDTCAGEQFQFVNSERLYYDNNSTFMNRCNDTYSKLDEFDELIIQNISVTIGDGMTTSESLKYAANILETYTFIDITDVYSSLSLATTNIVVSVFLIIGITLHNDPDANSIIVLIISLQVMIIAAFPVYTTYTECFLDDSLVNNANIMHVLHYLFGILLWLFVFIWGVFIFKGYTDKCKIYGNEKTNSYCCMCCCIKMKLSLICLSILLALIYINSSVIPERIQFQLYNWIFAVGGFGIWQWLTLEFFKTNSSNQCCSCQLCKRSYYCKNKKKKKYKCGQYMLTLFIVMFVMDIGILMYAQSILSYMNLNINDSTLNIMAVISWIVIVIGAVFWIIYLHLSAFGFFVFLSNKTLCVHVIIFSMVVVGLYLIDYFYHVMMQFAVMSIVAGIWIILSFVQFEKLRKFAMNVISIYLNTFDLTTDIYLIYTWIIADHYVWASLQILFIIVGQICGAVIHEFNIQLTSSDRCMILSGCGRSWLLIKSWSDKSDESDINHYKTLYDNQKIFELMFESFPSVALQTYILLITDSNSSTLYQSLFASFVSMTWGVWLYIITLTKNYYGDNDDQFYDPSIELQIYDDVENDITLTNRNKMDINKQTVIERDEQIQEPSSYDYFKSNKGLFFNFYFFVLSDFYIRTYPLIGIITLIHNNIGQYFGFAVFISLIIFLGIFEFIMNKKMRSHHEEYKQNSFVIKIFSISILSSFYSFLSTLDALSNNQFFGKSVNFNVYCLEHILRILLSLLLISIIILTKFVLGYQDEFSYSMWIAYIALLLTNLVNWKYVKKHNIFNE